jgi:hypothetical protein
MAKKKANGAITPQHQELINQVAAMNDDVAKFDAGNKAAGTRIRKALQDIKNKCQEMRNAVTEIRNSRA